jgi:hypothetical protein
MPEASGKKALEAAPASLPKEEAVWTDLHRDLNRVFIVKEAEQQRHSIGISVDSPYENQFSLLHEAGPLVSTLPIGMGSKTSSSLLRNH